MLIWRPTSEYRVSHVDSGRPVRQVRGPRAGAPTRREGQAQVLTMRHAPGTLVMQRTASQRDQAEGCPWKTAPLALLKVPQVQDAPPSSDGSARRIPATDRGPANRIRRQPVSGPHASGEPERAEVRAWARGIARRSTWTAQRAFEVLRRCYAWAVYEEELLRATPCERLRLGYQEAPSERVLNRDELRRLLGALDRLEGEREAYAVATRLLLLTAARRDAVVGARSDELEGDVWVVPPARSKSGRPHLVPLSPTAEAVFEARAAAVDAMLPGERLLFPQAPDPEEPTRIRVMTWSSRWVEDLRQEMAAVTKDWTLELDSRWRMHDLRHTVATVMTESLGVSRDVVALILGHSFGPRVTRVYDRAERLPERRAALKRWAEWLERLKEPMTARGKILALVR
jgi:integrase